MSISDGISDMLTAIRNANMRRHEVVDVPASRINESIVKILKDEAYITNFRVLKEESINLIRIYLKYHSKDKPVITNLKRISKPSLRIYVKKDKIPYVLRGKGIAIISTPKGVVVGSKARELKVGGEMICYVW